MIFRTNKFGKKYPIFNKSIKLGKKEYGHVCHEIETHGNINQKKENKLNMKDIGDYSYIYVYRQEQNIQFYGKVKIVGNKDNLDIVNEFIKEANQNVFW